MYIETYQNALVKQTRASGVDEWADYLYSLLVRRESHIFGRKGCAACHLDYRRSFGARSWRDLDVWMNALSILIYQASALTYHEDLHRPGCNLVAFDFPILRA